MVLNSIALKKAISRRPSGFTEAGLVERHLDLDVADELDELAGRSGPSRRPPGWSASRGASAA
jgi:hypothetical protein